MAKHFVIDPKRVRVENGGELYKPVAPVKVDAGHEPPPLKHTHGRVVVWIDHESKNSWRFENGVEIRYERQFDNFNRRETHPVNAFVISGENMPVGVEILVHPNAAAEHHQIHNAKPLSGVVTGGDIKYYSIPEDMCFAWKDGDGAWRPLPPYQTALRVFKPYAGLIEGIPPTKLNNTLYVLTGELKGKVVKTVIAADYVIVFQDSTGREGQLLRFRPFGDPKLGKEEEAVAILHEETEMVHRGELMVGLTTADAKTIVYGD